LEFLTLAQVLAQSLAAPMCNIKIMKKLGNILILSWLIACTSNQLKKPLPQLQITEIEPNKWTALTKQNLLQLFQVYDLTPLLFTRVIQVQSRVIPHSHPVLTLNTRFAEEPKKLLATWLHEELHWWVTFKKEQTQMALKELRRIYLQVPGANESLRHAEYLHLIVCYLEYKSLISYLGEKEAKKIIVDLIKKDRIYPWVYTQVLYKNYAVEKIVHKYGLIPPGLN
jgi:hypothetical protein